jgi:tripartite-type tricarboxylate transporter receptor subunit TctC
MQLRSCAAFVAACAFVVTAAGVLAQDDPGARDYPVKTIRLIVPLSPGGGTDIFARALAQRLSESYKRQIVIDNRPGASSIIGSDIAAKSPPDGHTLLMVSSTHTIVPNLVAHMPFHPINDFEPITLATAQPYVMGVHPSVPAKTARDFVALAKSRPGQLSYSSGGNGTAPHVGTELLKILAGIDLTHVAYKGGGPAMVAVLTGEVAMSFTSIPSTMPLVRAGKIRALAVTSLKRSAAAPQLPTLAESGIRDFEIINWYGLLAPRKTPPAIVGKLHADVARTIRAPDFRELLAKDGTDAVANTPDEFARYLRADLAKWEKVIKSAGLKAD